MMQTARAVLFDLDGTLIESAPSILSTLASALDCHGLTPRAPLSRSLIGPPLTEILRDVTCSDDPKLLNSLMQTFAALYDSQGYRATTAFDGIADLLADLEELGNPLFVVTNKRIKPTKRIIDWLGWGGFFEGVYSADAFCPALSCKHQVLAKVLAIGRMDPKGCVYVGDRREDYEAACAVGMQFVGVSWGYGSWEEAPDRALPPPLSVDQPVDLLAAIVRQSAL